MIEKIVIISLIVFAIHYTMQEGEIFGFLGDWFYKALPDKLHGPIFDCVVCMAPWYGTGIYWLLWASGWKECGMVVIAAMGLNVILSRIFSSGEVIQEDPEEIKMHFGR